MRRLSKILWLVALVLSVAPLSLAQPEPVSGVEKIVYVALDRQARTHTLTIADPDGSNVTPLVVDGFFFAPAWSPDGRHLVFMARRFESGTEDLYIIDSDGTNLRAAIPRPVKARPGYAAWSPDSTQLIYAGVRSDGSIAFYKIELDGNLQERVLLPDIARVVEPWLAWSPDGSQLAVHAESDNPDRSLSFFGQLYVTDADGTNAVAYPAVTSGGYSFSHLTWSPDGLSALLDVHSAFAINTVESLALANPDGSDVQAIVTPPPNYINSVSWSPDSSQILFIATELGGESMPDNELYVADADGSNVHSLNIDSDVHGVGTTWGFIPDDVVLPGAPISLTTAER